MHTTDPDRTSGGKLLFVIQRYGVEVDGGAELYCRWLAKHLKSLFTIDVLTSCATNYITWANVYESGVTEVDGVRVIRCLTASERDIDSFNIKTNRLLTMPHSSKDELDWLEAQGPVSPDMIQFISDHGHEYRCLVFFTYLYYPSVRGTLLFPSKSILIPTAHDEPVAHLEIFKELFSRIAGLLFLTYPEQDFVQSFFKTTAIPYAYLGTGIDLPPSNLTPDEFIAKYNLKPPVLLYVGRVEEGKGCREAASFFERYCEDSGFSGSLVFAGKKHMQFEETSQIRFLGFLPDNELGAAMDSAEIILVPSPFESLSILLLQAFLQSKPVLANARCAVLRDHCVRSNGGLFYFNELEFCEALDLMLNSRHLRRTLGGNGRKYVDRNFQWEAVRQRFQAFIDSFFPCDSFQQ